MHRVLQVDALAAWSTVIAADGCHRHVESMALELCNQCRCLFSFYASDSVSFNDMNDPMLGHKKATANSRISRDFRTLIYL